MDVQIKCSSFTRVGDRTYRAYPMEAAEFYKKSVTEQEFNNILQDIEDALRGKDPYRYKGLPSPSREVTRKHSERAASKRPTPYTPKPPVTAKGIITVGSTVRAVFGKGGSEATLHIVQSGEADPSKDRISVDSPIGKAIMGKRAGDTVTYNAPGGGITVRVISVS